MTAIPMPKLSQMAAEWARMGLLHPAWVDAVLLWEIRHEAAINEPPTWWMAL